MIKTIFKGLLTMLMTISAFPASASQPSLTHQQTKKLIDNTKIIYIDGKPDSLTQKAVEDSIKNEFINFYYDQFRHFNDPAAPYFQFMSRGNGISMGIGGAVRMRAYYDFAGALPIAAFSPYMIPIPKSETDRRQLGTTPAGTCLFFTVLGRNSFFGKYRLYIECNFNGYGSRDFKLKKAYAQFRDFTVGYAPSTFSDLTAQTPMVDANGPANKIAPSNVLVRYMPTVGRWVFAVSAESPDSPANYTVDENCAKVRNWSPDLCGFIQYQWALDQHIRLSGMYRNMSYRNLLKEKNYNVAGWGVQLSGVVKPLPQLTGYFSGCYGHGYTSVLNDLLMGKYDLMADPLEPGSMYSPGAYGWSAGLQYNFRPNLFTTVSMGQVRYLPQRKVSPDEYRYGQIIAANIFWNPTPRAQFGLEFDYGKRKNQSGADGTAHRIGAMVQFSF